MVDEKNQVVDDQMSEDDLDKIMKEIVAEETAVEASPAPTAQVASPAPVSTATTPTAAATTAKTQAQVTPLRAVTETRSKSSSEQGLKLEFTGPINLKLQFTTGNRTIDISCSDDALICRMADGTEFRIPTSALGTARKSA